MPCTQPSPARVCLWVGRQSRKAGIPVSEAGATLGPEGLGADFSEAEPGGVGEAQGADATA